MPITNGSQPRPASGYGPHSDTTTKNKPNSSSRRSPSPSKTPQKRRYKTCCGGKHIPEEEREAVLQGGENSKTFPGSQSCKDEDAAQDALLDNVAAVNSPRQDGGLFQMLLDDDGVIMDTDGSGGGQFSGVDMINAQLKPDQFSGVESTYTDNNDGKFCEL